MFSRLSVTLRTALVALALLNALAGCAAPSPTAMPIPAATATSAPTATFTPQPSPTPGPTDTPVAEPIEPPTPVPLDLCSLVTAEEAEAVLGEAVEVQAELGMGNCTYMTSSFPQKTLMVGAAQGEEAKALSLIGVQMLFVFFQDETIRETYEAVQRDVAEMTVEQVVAEVILLFAAVGYAVEPVSGIGDSAFWALQSEYEMGQLFIVNGDVYVYVTLIGLEEAAAFEASAYLAQQALDRLPPRFTVPVSGRFEFETVLPTVEITLAPPTDTPAPPPPTPMVTPGPEFAEQPSYTGDCAQRPAGSVCIQFADGYVWLVDDSVVGSGEDESWDGRTVKVVQGGRATYYHVLGTLLVKRVPG